MNENTQLKKRNISVNSTNKIKKNTKTDQWNGFLQRKLQINEKLKQYKNRQMLKLYSSTPDNSYFGDLHTHTYTQKTHE